MRVNCNFRVEKETDKAVQVSYYLGRANFEKEHFAWLPKSACEIETYIATYNALNEPETFGNRVVAVEQWLYSKNEMYHWC